VKPEGILIHCSASLFGSAIEINKWHLERGWDSIGYHFVICNGQVENNNYLSCLDGSIERGRDIDKLGAHAKGYNSYIGICLIGCESFTENQFRSLKKLVKQLMVKYSIPLEKVLGHYEVSNKRCPNFDVGEFRERLTSIFSF
jgi:N-acetylmuramoyl-L-alanine amidase